MATIEPAIEAALDQLRTGLDADGFRLGLHRLDPDGRIVISLEALPEACLDCLVPDAMLTQMVEMAVRGHVPDAPGVELVKIGFDGDSSHGRTVTG
jgi:Fe-S cluster biogenesis protein NfuA